MKLVRVKNMLPGVLDLAPLRDEQGRVLAFRGNETREITEEQLNDPIVQRVMGAKWLSIVPVNASSSVPTSTVRVNPHSNNAPAAPASTAPVAAPSVISAPAPSVAPTPVVPLSSSPSVIKMAAPPEELKMPSMPEAAVTNSASTDDASPASGRSKTPRAPK